MVVHSGGSACWGLNILPACRLSPWLSVSPFNTLPGKQLHSLTDLNYGEHFIGMLLRSFFFSEKSEESGNTRSAGYCLLIDGESNSQTKQQRQR